VAELPLPEPPLADGAVVLRPWDDGDLTAIVAACQDPSIPRYVSLVPSPYTEADARAWLAGQAPARRRGESLDLAITGAASGEVLGAIGLGDVDWRHRRGAVGYWLAPAGRGRGAATAALRLLADWAFAALQLGRLELVVEPVNAASVRVAERCGFVREGLLRSYQLIGGERRDMYIYGLLPNDGERR
jgi:RimJ/RimL family protein N-acetyltransferase